MLGRIPSLQPCEVDELPLHGRQQRGLRQADQAEVRIGIMQAEKEAADRTAETGAEIGNEPRAGVQASSAMKGKTWTRRRTCWT
jgi:hypothetical protein